MSQKGWIGVDLDGTLAHYDGWIAPTHIGAPVPLMLERVKGWLAEGREVRIFTARIWPVAFSAPGSSGHGAARFMMGPDPSEAIDAIRAWCIEHVGQDLAITCVKDYGMVVLYDDRAVQVKPNTGVLVEG